MTSSEVWDGPALGFAIGTGRVAVPLLCRGIAMSGIELSNPMLTQLRTKVNEQLECFRNAARHLRPGGRFVIELWVPSTPTTSRRSSARRTTIGRGPTW